GSAAASAWASAAVSGVAVRPADVITSPACSPARSAGPPGVTDTIPVPAGLPPGPDQVGRDREPDALGLRAAARAGRGQRRDADHLPGRVHQRPAAVARVDRRA